MTAPAAPTSLVATAGDRAVALDWASNAEIDLAGYRVYRDGAPIATPNASTYADSGLTNGTTYTYTVTAYDGADNESAASQPASATPTPATYQPTSSTIPSGTLSGGSVSSLYANDGNRLVITTSRRTARSAPASAASARAAAASRRARI